MLASMNAIPIHIPPALKVTNDQFEQLAAAKRDLRLKRTASGELIVIALSGGDVGKRNAKLSAPFVVRNNQTHLSEVFDSSTVFQLPNGADRSPDVSWVTLDAWNTLTPEQQEPFPPLCPDFVLELHSRTDSIASRRKKMHEYLDHKLWLGWLIDPKAKTVEIYRPNQFVDMLQSPTQLPGDDVLPGFVLILQPVLS